MEAGHSLRRSQPNEVGEIHKLRQHKMRRSHRPGGGQLPLLSLALLLSVPWSAVTSYPHSATAATPLPTIDAAQLESAFLELKAALKTPSDSDWEERELRRALRGDPMAQPLSPFPGGLSLESIHYQQGEDGGRRNEALTSIVGGLQAVGREKGGFGFRFGRKRWTDGAWSDGGRRGTDEDEWRGFSGKGKGD